MKEIRLTKGMIAIVDDWWYDKLLSMLPEGHKWTYTSHGYAKSSLGYMHQIICPTPSGFVTDHIDNNKLNNQESNLRSCSMSQNASKAKLRNTNTSGYRGVCIRKDTGKYRAHITIDGKIKMLGQFDTIEDAALAYNLKAKEVFGEFAVLNVIN